MAVHFGSGASFHSGPDTGHDSHALCTRLLAASTWIVANEPRPHSIAPAGRAEDQTGENFRMPKTQLETPAPEAAVT